MLIDAMLLSGFVYLVYLIVMSILDNGDSWLTYRAKHRKKFLYHE